MAVLAGTTGMTPARPVARGPTLRLIVDALRRQRVQDKQAKNIPDGMFSLAAK
jgi:hypothetical protein